jgi:uncharacterized protein DUF2795
MHNAFPVFSTGKPPWVDAADAAALKSLLVGVSLPAEKPELLAYAVQQRAEPSYLGALRSLSDEKKYESLDDVVEDLLQVQPSAVEPEPQEPHEESGAPPGGESYTDPHPESGEVTPD